MGPIEYISRNYVRDKELKFLCQKMSNFELSINEKKFAKRYVDMYIIQVFKYKLFIRSHNRNMKC